MDAHKKLKTIFEGTNTETRLVFLSPSTRLRIGKKPVQLARYELGDDQTIYAAFDKERNEIYLRLMDLFAIPEDDNAWEIDGILPDN